VARAPSDRERGAANFAATHSARPMPLSFHANLPSSASPFGMDAGKVPPPDHKAPWMKIATPARNRATRIVRDDYAHLDGLLADFRDGDAADRDCRADGVHARGGLEAEARVHFDFVDADRNGSVSKLELIDAVYRDAGIAKFLLQGICDDRSLETLGDEQRFDIVDGIFDSMGGGRPRITFSDFLVYFQRELADHASNSKEIRRMFQLADADGRGSISKLDMLRAAQRDRKVSNFLVPGLDCRLVMRDEHAFDTISSMFDSIACGKRRIEYVDFERFYRRTSGPALRVGPRHEPAVRFGKRVLLLAPGFAGDSNVRQAHAIQSAGFEVHWATDLPDPVCAHLNPSDHINRLRRAVTDLRPDVVVAASSGGAHLVDLWKLGLWRGPAVMINAHPSVARLPSDACVVLAHGANDEVFKRSRRELEQIVSSGSPNMCFLYLTGNSGEISPGAHTRLGDRHQMHSLTLHDCLPRLIDAAMAGAVVEETGGPEAHFVRSWRGRLSDQRLEAEHWLGYTTERLRSRWVSPGRRGADERNLFEVPRGCEEFANVEAIFRAAPREASDYELGSPAAWARERIARIERVENGAQEAGSARPYAEAVRRAFSAQGLRFEPGVHTCWAWHGTCAGPAVLESIVSDPVAGFQPLTTGARNKPLWGLGAYFARDAQYVSEGQFCGPAAPDGTRQMVLCLLTIGLPCLGAYDQRGVLPFRRKPHRYNSSVDSLSSPEIFALQHPGAAYPAYVVSFG